MWGHTSDACECTTVVDLKHCSGWTVCSRAAMKYLNEQHASTNSNIVDVIHTLKPCVIQDSSVFCRRSTLQNETRCFIVIFMILIEHHNFIILQRSFKYTDICYRYYRIFVFDIIEIFLSCTQGFHKNFCYYKYVTSFS